MKALNTSREEFTWEVHSVSSNFWHNLSFHKLIGTAAASTLTAFTSMLTLGCKLESSNSCWGTIKYAGLVDVLTDLMVEELKGRRVLGEEEEEKVSPPRRKKATGGDSEVVSSRMPLNQKPCKRIFKGVKVWKAIGADDTTPQEEMNRFSKDTGRSKSLASSLLVIDRMHFLLEVNGVSHKTCGVELDDNAWNGSKPLLHQTLATEGQAIGRVILNVDNGGIESSWIGVWSTPRGAWSRISPRTWGQYVGDWVSMDRVSRKWEQENPF